MKQYRVKVTLPPVVIILDDHDHDFIDSVMEDIKFKYIDRVLKQEDVGMEVLGEREVVRFDVDQDKKWEEADSQRSKNLIDRLKGS